MVIALMIKMYCQLFLIATELDAEVTSAGTSTAITVITTTATISMYNVVHNL